MGHTDLSGAEPQGEWMRGLVDVDGAKIGYTLCQMDGRAGPRKSADTRARALGGGLNVVIPGHGQTPAGVRNLMRAVVDHGRSWLVWCVDVDPPPGGDPVKAQALIKIVQEKVEQDIAWAGPDGADGIPITLFGWSHGGAEALRAAEMAPAMFEQVVALCPAGLMERQSVEFAAAFLWEYITAVWEALIRWDGSLRRVTAVAWNALGGVSLDVLRSRSLRRIADDLQWATRKVVGQGYSYGGAVAVLFGERDDLIRWGQVFPDCAELGQLDQHIEQFRKTSFPCVSRLSVAVLEGDHMAPEILATVYVRTAYGLLGLGSDHQR